MHTTDEAGRTASLVLELPSGTAILHGEPVALPLREFRLLAELAARVGEPVSPEDLIQAIWPDEPWTPKENLYMLTTRLRRLIDGSTKFGSHIRNKRGFGYFLDLDPKDVAVVDRVLPAHAREDLVVKLEPEGTVAEPTPAHLPITEAEPRRVRVRAVLAVSLIAVMAIVASWSAGYLLSSRSASGRAPILEHPEAIESASSSQPPRDKHEAPGQARSNKPRPRNGGRGARGSAQPTAPVYSQTESFDDPAAQSTQGPRKGSAKKQTTPKPAAVPAAPTRFLYHLVNEATGDHFVTTDGNVASEYEAQGYSGGAIARVYTESVRGTKAISTNEGTAYVFISSAPRTEPASKIVTLWYATDDSGDFFYTTSEKEARQQGWQASLIGYARST